MTDKMLSIARGQIADLTAALARAEARAAAAERKLAEVRALVEAQALDEGLWFIAATAPEGYLQQELRRLHAAIEGQSAARAAAAEGERR